jgi:ABC-type transport system involved in multi-copper enzyme maturation permease subunit
VVAFVTFLFCVVIGAALPADCLSRERREGTLGLLFLTNLNSAEVVAGKVLSTTLAAGYGLLAVFPLLAVTLLLGGVPFDEFWRVALALVNALLVTPSPSVPGLPLACITISGPL